ncbi:MAG: efflux RND transporter permease subunit [Pseudomonadota bacterium]
MSTSTKILRAIEPIIYAKPRLTMTILVLLTIFFGYVASGIKPDAGYDKSIPLEHPYMQVLKQYQADFGGANNVLVALIQKPGKGEIYNGPFLASLKQATDEVFFLPGVDRSRVSSLFTPDVRYVEVVEGGFKGGNVIPAEYAPTPEMFGLVKGNTQKGGHVGRFTTKDQTGAMIFSELLEVDPVTGEKLDYAAVAEILEDKVRGRFMSPKKYLYKLNADLCQTPPAAVPAAPVEGAEAAPPPPAPQETCVKAGTQVWERFGQPTGLAAAVDKGKPITFKFKPEGQDNELVFKIKKSQMSFEMVDNPQYNPDVDVHILGFAKVVGDIIEELIPVVGFFMLTLVMTQLLLWAYLGSFKLALLPLVSSIAAVVWEFGLLKLFGKGLDPFAILVPFLILSISVSHGVQYCNSWVGEIANNGRNSFDASVETWRRLAIYGTMAILTGVVGFALIGLIPIDIIREMSLNACLGMFAIVITNKIMMPIMLTWIDVGDPKAFKEKQEQRDSIFDPLWNLLSNMVLIRPAIIAILIGSLLLGWSLWKGKELQVGDSQAGVPELLPDSRYNNDTAAVTANFSIGTDVMKVIAEADPESCVKYPVMDQIDRFGWRMDNTEGVQSTISLPWAARQVNMAFSEAAPKFKVLPQNQFTMVQAITPIPTSSGLLNSNCSAMAVFIFTKDHKASTLERIVQEVGRYNVENSAEFYETNTDVNPEYCESKAVARRAVGNARVSLQKFTEKLKKKNPGIGDEAINANADVVKLNADIDSSKEKLAALDKACPVNFALASAQVGVMAATNEEVHRLEKPILYIVYAGIIVCVFLSFFEWQSIVAIMLPLALVSWMAYAVMAILGIGMKTATLPVVALAAGVGVDYGIYIYATFADALAAGYKRKAAYFKTLKLTGKAVAFTGLTLSLGVMTWLWSGLQFQRDMGKLLVFMFMANMFGALLLLPAIASFILKPKELAPGEEPVFKPRH